MFISRCDMKRSAGSPFGFPALLNSLLFVGSAFPHSILSPPILYTPHYFGLPFPTVSLDYIKNFTHFS